MRYLFLTLFALAFLSASSKAQNITDALAKQPSKDYDNVLSEKLYGDSLVSSFVIWIKKEVKPHRHLKHSEHVYVLEGTGTMRLGEKQFAIKAGDVVFIPKNMVHSLVVSSTVPVKVISVQAPEFDGTDRVMEK